MSKRHLVLIAIGLMIAVTSVASAQTDGGFDLAWSSVSSGGNSAGGAYRMYDTRGQPVVGEMSGGPYRLQAGFLSGPLTVSNLVLLYINGDNDLADEIRDLPTKAQLGAANADAVILMVLDGPKEDDSALYLLNQSDLGSCDFFTDPTCHGHYIDGYNMHRFPEDLGNGNNLAQFIQESIQTYPQAKRVILSLVGHGGGWSPNLLAGQPKEHVGQPDELGGLLWDDHTGPSLPGDSLSTIELGAALRTAYNATHRKIDLLYLDACLMGMWEVAYEIRDSVNYLLASESWSWTTFVYDQHLRDLHTTQAVNQVGQAWLQEEAAILQADGYPYTYSLIDLNQMEVLTQAINTFATVLISVTSTDKAKIENAFQMTDCFDNNADSEIDRLSDHKDSTKPGDNYCDLESFTRQITATFESNSAVFNAALAVQAALKQAVQTQDYKSGVPARYSPNPWIWKHLGGLSIYLPLNRAKDDWKRRFYHQMQSSRDSLWDDFITAYWSSTNPPSVPDCAAPCSLPRGPLVAESKLYLPLIRR